MLKELEEFVMKGCHGSIPNEVSCEDFMIVTMVTFYQNMVKHTIELPSNSQSELAEKSYELIMR